MINQRIFSANVGEPSIGNKGPDAIETDIDNLLANDQELLAAINEHETQINSLADDVDLKADTEHDHSTSDITDFPTALPADGGNADTVDGKHIVVVEEASKGTDVNTIYFCY